MNQQDKVLLQKLGYVTEGKKMRFFNDLIHEVEECICENSNEDVVELVNNKQSYLYVEMKMFYEIGLNRMQNELDYIQSTMRDFSNVDMEVYENVFGTNYNPTVEESILSIAKYRNKQKNQEPTFYIRKKINTGSQTAV